METSVRNVGGQPTITIQSGGNSIILTREEFMRQLELANKLSCPDNGVFGNVEIRPSNTSASNNIEIIIESLNFNQTCISSDTYSPPIDQRAGNISCLLELLKCHPQGKVLISALLHEQQALKGSR